MKKRSDSDVRRLIERVRAGRLTLSTVALIGLGNYAFHVLGAVWDGIANIATALFCTLAITIYIVLENARFIVVTLKALSTFVGHKSIGAARYLAAVEASFANTKGELQPTVRSDGRSRNLKLRRHIVALWSVLLCCVTTMTVLAGLILHLLFDRNERIRTVASNASQSSVVAKERFIEAPVGQSSDSFSYPITFP